MNPILRAGQAGAEAARNEKPGEPTRIPQAYTQPGCELLRTAFILAYTKEKRAMQKHEAVKG